MKAAVYRRYGAPDVVRVEETDTPIPGDDDVLVRVIATTVSTPDWRFRRPSPWLARLASGLIAPKKQVLGMEFAGRIEAVGKNVTRFAIGDDVFGSTGFLFGAHAEFVRLPQDHRLLSEMPRAMTHEQAAAVLFGGLSALWFLRKAGVKAGQNVLIYGASGSVGVFAVQLAKHFGARVTGVCSTANVDMVRSLGADAVIDYTRDDFTKAGRVYDVIIDTVGKSGPRAPGALKRGGVFGQVALADLASTLAWLGASMTGGAKIVGGLVRGTDADQLLLKTLIEAGALRTVIDKRYTLDQIAEAHAHAESGRKKGHVVIVMGGA